MLFLEHKLNLDEITLRRNGYIDPSYMLENKALAFLPGTVNSGLCGKATFGMLGKGCGMR